MYKVQKIVPFRFSKDAKFNKISLLHVATTILFLGIILSFTTSFWDNLLPSHSSKFSAKAATSTPLVRRVNIPYFSSTVPFNQTAIFWFGQVSSTSNYTDVRIGYSKSELYIDLHRVDRWLWYDTNTQAPDLTKGDNATIYLNTTQNSGSTSYKFQAGVNGYVARNNYQKAYSGNGTAWTAANIPFTAVYGWRGHGLNGAEGRGWSMTYHIPFASLGVSTPSQGALWKLGVRVHNRDDAANTPIPD
ncbi:MAG: hypothetical protein M3Z24_16795, partial [Chloroflexota bacterium]|nr:hypothetical protein [Chloroflexota bacterium]